MDDQKLEDLRATYDRVAGEYARRIADELKDKPLDRQLLEQLAGRLRGRGLICDLGCGPGHVARYLHECGAEALGLDLSEAMLAQARRLNPGLRFQAGNMLALTDIADEAWAGIAAFYSIIHIPAADLPVALRELKRVLQPEGLLLLAFHIGAETVHLDEWWGQPVSADFFFYPPAVMVWNLETAGFLVEAVIEREPYPDVEYPSRRAYVWARKPAASETL
jgi:SAM-dependent methyltransferase